MFIYHNENYFYKNISYQKWFFGEDAQSSFSYEKLSRMKEYLRIFLFKILFFLRRLLHIF